MIDLCIAYGIGKINLLHGIPKLKGPGLGIYFIATTGFKSLMIA